MAHSNLIMGETQEAKRGHWKDSFNAVQNEIWIDPVLPAKLYHYSNLAAVKNILSSREMWLTNIRYAKGDADDGTYWINVFRPIINRKSVPDPVKRLFYGEFAFGLGTLWHEFIACFSPEPELEEQRKNYADDGRGCAIELSFDSLHANCDGGKAYAWMPMLYDPAKQVAKAEKTIDAAIMLARSEGITRQERDTYWQEYACYGFLHCGLRFKHPRFSAEKEWRVFRSALDLSGARFRQTANGRIPYLPWPLPPELVTGVIKGPACTSSDEELAELLASGGFATHVRTHRPATFAVV